MQENEKLQTEVDCLQTKLQEKDEAVKLLEKDIAQMQQYERRSNIEIAGISEDIDQQHLEKKIIEIGKAVDIKVSSNDIQACHRLKKSRRANNQNRPRNIIVRFVNRKTAESFLAKWKQINDLNKENLGIGNSTIYVNNNLCPYYKFLWGQVKNLFNHDVVKRFWTFNGTINYALTENGPGVKVLHLDDLKNNFPDFEFS